jgi:hypothetical protein
LERLQQGWERRQQFLNVGKLWLWAKAVSQAGVEGVLQTAQEEILKSMTYKHDWINCVKISTVYMFLFIFKPGQQVSLVVVAVSLKTYMDSANTIKLKGDALLDTTRYLCCAMLIRYLPSIDYCGL